MRYVFFGTPRFAEIVLEGLIRADMPPVALVCNPDRPVGHKHIITEPPTKILANENNIPVYQPESLFPIPYSLFPIKADFFIVAAYAKIIPKSILDIPRLGTLGVHPSLLPKYRGASPIQSTILAGEKETGTTIYMMDEKMDHGPIVASSEWRITNDESRMTNDEWRMKNGVTYLELEKELAKLGVDLLTKTIPDFLAGKIRPEVQDESQATFTKKFKTEDGFVAEEDCVAAERGDAEKASQILRKINALNPEPGVWTMEDGKRVKLIAAEIQNGALHLLVTQREGEKAKRNDEWRMANGERPMI